MNYILNHRATLREDDDAGAPPSDTTATATSREKWKDSYGHRGSPPPAFNVDGAEKKDDGRIWFCTEQLLPMGTSEALHRMFQDHPGILSNFPSMHSAGDKHPASANRNHSDESGSESAIGSSHDTGSYAWRESYPVSLESATSCDCSDADDDSDACSFRGMSKVTSGKAPSAEKDDRQLCRSFQGSQPRASKGLCSTRSCPSADGRNRDPSKVNQTPLCNLQDAGKGNSAKDSPAADFWDTFGRLEPSFPSLSVFFHVEKQFEFEISLSSSLFLSVSVCLSVCRAVSVSSPWNITTSM